MMRFTLIVRLMASKPPFDRVPNMRPAWHRVAVWIVGFAALIVILHYFVSWAVNLISEMNTISGSMTMVWVLTLSLIVYAILIATPFMPGIEVGIALLLLQGAKIAPFVYLATVAGLMTAYLIGRNVPFAWVHKFFCDLGMRRVCTYLESVETTSQEKRLAKQRTLLPGWLGKLTVNYRYASIGVLLNVPGTFAIGGGGGILMAAGLSRLFNGWVILLTLAIATMPVPLVVWVMGVSILGGD